MLSLSGNFLCYLQIVFISIYCLFIFRIALTWRLEALPRNKSIVPRGGILSISGLVWYISKQ